MLLFEINFIIVMHSHSFTGKVLRFRAEIDFIIAKILKFSFLHSAKSQRYETMTSKGEWKNSLQAGLVVCSKNVLSS